METPNLKSAPAMYMCVKGINVASVSMIYLIDFGTVLMEWFFI
jgi:hypothetical protein